MTLHWVWVLFVSIKLVENTPVVYTYSLLDAPGARTLLESELERSAGAEPHGGERNLVVPELQDPATSRNAAFLPYSYS